MKTFKHSGDMGDIIMSLPAIKELGGGILYLDPQGGEAEPLVQWGTYTHTKLNEGSINFLSSLLTQQDYIHEVRLWDSSKKVDHNLDEFRLCNKYNNLTKSHLDAVGKIDCFDKWVTEPWLSVNSKELPEGKDVILARSCRYHSNYTFWETLPDDIIDRSAFMSTPEEFEYFLYTYPRYKGRIAHLETSNVLDLAGYIQGCSTFVCNQGFPLTVAEALKKSVVLEVYRLAPAAIFERDGIQYV
jgi:hypothetical protein